MHGLFAAPPRRTRSRGQALAEFALVFPIMMLLVGAVFQFGIIFWGQNTLNQVARDTGRWAATQQTPCTGSATAAIGAVRTTARAIAANSALIGYTATPSSWADGDIQVTYSGATCPPNNNSQIAWVEITIDHTVPIFFPFVPGNGNISTTTEFRMEPAP